MKTLKHEKVYHTEYRDQDDAYTQIAEFLERVYSRQRLHSALGYVPPAEVEQNGRSQWRRCAAPLCPPPDWIAFSPE